MSIGRFFSRRKETPAPVPPPAPRAEPRVEPPKKFIPAAPSGSRNCVLILTPSHELRLHFKGHLRGVVADAGFEYMDDPKPELATAARIVILDATPRADALWHDKYDKILRLKKAMGRMDDVFSIFGPRANFKKYPRGTYPKLQFFCIVPEDLGHRDADLPPEGTDTVEGPRLYNFADIPQVIAGFIKQMSLGRM